MTITYDFRPLSAWPWPATPPDARRSRWAFKATYEDTLDKVFYELSRLDATRAIIQTFHEHGDIRKDGLPRSNARQPTLPGVVLTAVTPKGTLTWRADHCDLWWHNLRSIALGLEALRAVDRHGITVTGEQYAGFREIPATGMGPADADPWAVLADAGGISIDTARTDPQRAYRNAARLHHPDQGGDPEAWLAIDRAWRSIR